MLQLDYAVNKALAKLRDNKLSESIRVETVVAKRLLLNDSTVTKDDTVRWMRFRNLGLGVWEVWLESLIGSAKKNIIVK